MTITPARRVQSVDELVLPGDYFGPVDEVTDKGVKVGQGVWFLLPIHTPGKTRFDRTSPGDGLHRVSSPPWSFRECPDGSLEIRASIACGRGSADGEYWHGYLDEGNRWRDVGPPRG